MGTLLTDNGFKELHRECEYRLITFAFGIVRDFDTARDIVYECFMEMWEQQDKMEYANIRAYIFQMVRNKSLSHRKKEQVGRSVYEKIRRKERAMMDIFTESIERCNPAELFCSEIVEICETELARMPELRKKIFVASKVEGQSYQDIANAFNVDLKKVDNELHKATAKLRHSLVDYLTLIVLFLS